MGKPFNNELEKIQYAIQWAENQDVDSLSNFLFGEGRQTQLVCIGSGGSLSACHYAAMLSQQRNGVLAVAMIPMQLMYSGREIIRNSKLLFISASGKNKDVLNAIKYGVKYNEAGMMSLTLCKGNPTEELLAEHSKVQRWCETIPTEKDGFLATNSLVATFTLLCKAAGGIKIQYSSFKSDWNSEIRDLNISSIQNFIVLYGAAGEPVAWDIESKLTEAALGSALLSDYRNFGHGRHNWFAKGHGATHSPERGNKQFRDLIESFQQKGYDPSSLLVMDRDLNLDNGTHRLAICLMNGIYTVRAKVLRRRALVQKTIDWYYNVGLESGFLAEISDEYKRIYNGLITSGHAFLCRIEGDVKAVADDIRKDLSVLSGYPNVSLIQETENSNYYSLSIINP